MFAFRLTLPQADEDSATTALWELGSAGAEMRAAAAGRIELLAYFANPPELAALRSRLPLAEIAPVAVPEVDWLSRFREGFQAFRAGRFQIVPVWQAAAASRDLLVVDPGRAFGTGTHETTRLCLAALEQVARRRSLGRALDLGAGTGILAIAARRLGAGPVVASDLDPEATASARAHARLNEVSLDVVRADGARGFRPASFDLVLANLMTLLLVDRAAEIRELLAPGGTLVLSGLLVDDVPQVRRAFSSCGRPRERQQGEWAALVYEEVA